ncbi:MAG TPA: hypothetical protein EYH49_06545 [Aquifex aeolicus]|nr:hypothetical protein [Aquifex aeolicus]
MRTVLLSLLCACSLAHSHPLLNLNAEERTVYDNLESSEGAKYFTISIRPYSYGKAYRLVDFPERVRLYMNALSPPGYFLKPVNSLTLRLFFTGEEAFVLENSAGTLLEKGLSAHAFLDGYLSVGHNFVLYYQVRHVRSESGADTDLLRAYAKVRIRKFSFEFGKDTVHLGPGEMSLLLSTNAEPFLMAKVQTEESLEFFGLWDFLFLRGWLKEEREDRSDPNILALRVVWKPHPILELGITRTSLYGGEGRPGYKLSEYPKLILGIEENVPFGKYDTDGYGAWDVSLYLPLERWVGWIRSFKLYYQEAGTDILAWWQKEDRGKFALPFGFTLLDKGYVIGALLSLRRDIIRLEFSKTSRFWYKHHLYPKEGYTYKGMSLGHPYGGNMWHVMFKHRHYFGDYLSAGYRVGFFRQPAFDSATPMERMYIVLFGEKRLRSFILEGFVRFDRVKNYDADPSPNDFEITPEEKSFITLGTSVSWRF